MSGDLERGSVTVVAAGIMTVIAVLALGSVDLWRVLAAKERAQTAADAAALASAQEMVLPSGTAPAEAARDFAAYNGAVLTVCGCAAGSQEAVVEVEVEAGPLILLGGSRVVHASARAVVGASLETPRSPAS